MKYITITLLVFVSFLAKAQTITWDGGAETHNWEDALNWSGNVLPTILKDVVIDNDSVSINSNVTIKSLTLKSTHQIENKQAVFLQNGYSLSIFNSSLDGLYLQNDSRFWNAGNTIIANALNAMYLESGSIFENMANQGFVAISLASIGVFNFGTFQNRFNAELEISDCTTGIANKNQISNRGEINTLDVPGAIINEDTFLNRGLLNFTRTSIYGLSSSDYFKNFSNGVIQIDTCENGIIASKDFINEGLIEISQATENGLKDGVYDLELINSGTINVSNSTMTGIKLNNYGGVFTNETNGILKVDSSGQHGINTFIKIINDGEILIDQTTNYGFITSVDTLVNNGSIKIENSSSLGLTLEGVLINNSNAKIEIDAVVSKGLSAKKNVINEGEIIIKNSGSGLTVTRDTLVNSGSIVIENISSTGIYHYGDLLLNTSTGEIWIDGTLTEGFKNESGFLNEGSLNIKNSDESGLMNLDTVINNGNIEIIVLNEGLTNEGNLILNNSCGKIHVKGLISTKGEIDNKGLLENDNAVPIMFDSGGSLKNDGTFFNSQIRQPISADFINNGNVIYPLLGTLSDGIKEMNVALSGLSPLHTIPPTWWADEGLTIVAGTYDNGDKSFTPNAAGLAADTLWLELNSGSCPLLLKIPVNKPVNCSTYPLATFTGAVSSDWHTAENWDTGYVPSPCTITIIPMAKNCTITTGRKARAFRIEAESGSVFEAELGVVLEVNPNN